MTVNKVNNIQDAVSYLQNLGISANIEPYGFSLILKDTISQYSVQCGYESDGTFSLCFQVADGNNQWFVGSDVEDIVEFIRVANEEIRSNRKHFWEDTLNSVHVNSVSRVYIQSS